MLVPITPERLKKEMEWRQREWERLKIVNGVSLENFERLYVRDGKLIELKYIST